MPKNKVKTTNIEEQAEKISYADVVKFIKSQSAVGLACFETSISPTSEDKIMIIRIADRYGWFWNAENGKTYGDYVTVKPFKEPKLERKLAKLMDIADRLIKKGADQKTIDEAQADVVEVAAFYQQIKEKDSEEILATLIQQADVTIERVRAEIDAAK